MTIYLDVVVLENLIMNGIILYATAIVSKTPIHHIRIFLASLLGAIYSVISYISQLAIYSNLLLKILLSILMVYLAFNPQSKKKLWKELLLFYLTSFVFGGVAFALIYIVKPQDILMKNGLFLGTYPLKTVFLGAIIGFILWITASKMLKSKFTKKDMLCEVTIWLNDKEVRVQTMIDTGNMLKEPISGAPVIVVEHTALYEILPKEILDHLDDILAGNFEKLPEEVKQMYEPKLKLIPYSSLGKQNGMLLAVKAQKVDIEKEEGEKQTRENVMIGIYNKSLTKRGEYRGLMGMELME